MNKFLSICALVFACAAAAAQPTPTPPYLACPTGVIAISGGVTTYGPVCATAGVIQAGVGGAQTTINGTGTTFPDGTVQTTAATNGGGGTTTGSTSSAQVNEIDNLAAAQSVAATRPLGGTGSTPSKKDSTNCLSAWTSASGYAGSGHRYCTLAQMNTAHAAQTAASHAVDSYSYITLTQANAGSISPVNSNGAGGSDAPSTMTTEYGETTYDSLCNNGLLTAATNIPNLSLPACGTGITALLAETTDGTYGAASTLWPTNFPTTQAGASDHWMRSGMFMMPTVSATSRIEFDINKSDSSGSYEGPGTSFNITSGRMDFLPQANYFIGHGTCSGTWCPLNLNLQTGSTAMTGCPGGSGANSCALTNGHFYAFIEKGHLPGTTVTEHESQDGKTIPRTVYQYDEFDIADCGTSGTSCPADYSRYTLTDPGNSNAPPQGYDVQYGWPQGFDTQWQLYPQTVSTTATLHIINDVTQWYQIVKGTSTTNYASAPANLGDFEGNSNTNNSDSSGGDSTTLACTGGVSYDLGWFVSSAASFNFNAVGDTCTATLPASETTLTQRAYLGTNQFSTSSTGSAQLLDFISGTHTVLEVYENDGASNLTLYLPVSTTAAALSCTLDSSTAAQATVLNNEDYWDITWHAGTSTTTGYVQAAFDGAAPTAANCSWLGAGINTTVFSWGTATGISTVEFGYISDSGSVSTNNFDIDMFGLSSGTTFLGAGIPVNTTVSTYQSNLSVTQSTGGLDVSPSPWSMPGMTLSLEPATYLACYTTGGALGHCATAPIGTPPTCGCTVP